MSAPQTPTEKNLLIGMLLMTAAAFALAAMHGLVRKVSGDLHPFEISFFRNLFGLIVLSPLIIKGGLRNLRTYQPRLQIFRGFNSVAAMSLWFFALSVVPLAEATAMSFLAVIFASIGAVLFLGERMRARRWTAVGAGLIGALIILRPGFTELNYGLVLTMMSALCWGTGVVLVKQLSKTDSIVSVVGWFGISTTIISFVPALMFWSTPTLEQLGWLLLIGTLGTIGHLAMTRSLKTADAGAVMPLDFTRLVWASLLGYWLFNEVPDVPTLLGGAVIIGSATYLIVRESRLKVNKN